jgi:glyoxylase-like metal-dependent hydrolase (beta-lactamase superfamily II)
VDPSGPWREIADRVFVRRYEFFDQTIGVVIGAAGAVVIDTRAVPSQAEELRDDLRRLTDAPLAAVINTHHHYDHSFGNATFRPAPIWGHARCAATLRERGEDDRQRVMREMPALADELARVEITPPDVTFDDVGELDLGDRVLELRHLGRGHTDNDAVIGVRGAQVLFAGDLYENGAPPSFGDAYPVAWAATAARLAPLVDGVVVPGHGEPADRAFADRQTGELGEVAALCRAVVAGELAADDAIRSSPYSVVTTRHALRRARIEALD